MIVRPGLSPEVNAFRYRVLGAAFRVHSVLGPALKEKIYQRCLAHALRNDGFHVETERPLDVSFEGLELPRALRIDLVVDDALVIEVKAADVPLAVWNSQMLSYLWHSGLPLGYLINFHVTHLRQGIRPFLNLPDMGPVDAAALKLAEEPTPSDSAGEPAPYPS